MQPISARHPSGARRAALAALLGVALVALGGCGAGATPNAGTATSSSVPAYVTEPFTHQQQLVQRGARLIVADGCSACHLNAADPHIAPDFSSFAGHRVKLSDGRVVLVDERFLREGLLHPRGAAIAGYATAPMLAVLARLQLDRQPTQVAALVAFIEQVGPEPETGRQE